MTAELSERRRYILKLVVQEYIETSVPVASELLTRKYGLSVSSATVRNELAALEDLGYLMHLHTSAGRIPTDVGYRYYVENLMERAPLSSNEQRTIRHQFYQVRSEFDQWIQLAGAVLARTTQNASVVTPPRANQARFKHLELLAIYEMTLLLVLVLHDGTIRQQTLTLESATSQEELSRTAARINDICRDASPARLDELRSVIIAGSTIEGLILDTISRAMQQYEDQLNRAIHSDGLIEALSQPEFTEVGRVRQIVEILQGGKAIGLLIPRALSSSGVQVVIGGEHSANEMRAYSVVLSRYGVDGEVVGVLGVVGPTRLAYPRTISAVRYIAAVMSDMLGDLYGTDGSPRVANDEDATERGMV